ncbi:mitochondrial basic amino acids transporter-like isoform X2 [Oscarella lobularis]|uniref:mitochondrial basic amino acids transporter-like isoform X2 n=1 Tax=Oscarella lobularis TaxID=121494 RepID=UPI00331358AE
MAADFLAGWCGGVTAVIVGHPFDTVKIRLQTQAFGGPKYNGTFHCFSSIIRQESITGLYKGVSSPFVGQTFLNAIVFGVYGRMVAYLTSRSETKKPRMRHILLSGAVAGVCQAPVCSVFDLVKTRLQIQGKGERAAVARRVYSGPINCLIKIYQEEGLQRGICRGMLSTMLRDVPGSAIYFGVYSGLSGLLLGGHFGVLPVLLAAGTTGCISWLCILPFDVVKSRIQADGVGGVSRYSGILDCFRKSYADEGLAAFTRGMFPTLLRAFPTNAAVLLSVEVILKLTNSRGIHG